MLQIKPWQRVVITVISIYKGGKKFAHTIDPKTGYPVQHSLLSATVLAKNCATADAYATSFMVMGVEKARKLLDRHPELMAYFIYSDAKGNLKNMVQSFYEREICRISYIRFLF